MLLYEYSTSLVWPLLALSSSFHVILHLMISSLLLFQILLGKELKGCDMKVSYALHAIEHASLAKVIS